MLSDCTEAFAASVPTTSLFLANAACAEYFDPISRIITKTDLIWSNPFWIQQNIQSYPTGLPFRDFLPLDQDRILMVFFDRLFEWSPSNPNLIPIYTTNDSSQSFHHISYSNDGGAWIIGSSFLLKATGNPFRFERFPYPKNTVITEVHECLESDGGELFFSCSLEGSQKSILRFDKHRVIVDPSTREDASMAWRGPQNSTLLFYDYKNEHDQPLIVQRYPNGTEISVKREGLMASNVNDIDNESDDVFWISTLPNGIARFAPSVWQTPVEIQDVVRYVPCIAEDPFGRVWFVCEDILLCFDNQRWRRYKLPQTAGWNRFHGIGFLANGKVLIICQDRLYCFDPTSFRSEDDFREISLPDGKVIPTISFLRNMNDQQIYVKTALPAQNCVYLETINTNLTSITEDSFQTTLHIDGNETKATTFWNCIEDKNKDYWLAHKSGITRYSQGVYTDYGKDCGYTDYQIFNFIQVDAQTFWCGGIQYLHRFDGKQWSIIDEVYDVVSDLLKTSDGLIWACTGRGLYRYNGQSWNSFTKDDGLPITRVQRVFEDSQGRIWAGTTSGLSLYHPEADQDPPRVLFDSEKNIRQIAPHGSAQFVFSGLDKWKYTSSSRLKYSHRIDEQEWSPFSEDTTVTVSGLSSGYHTFQVRAMDRNWNISNPVSWKCEVLLPWSRQPGFLALSISSALLTMAAIGYAMYRHLNLEYLISKRTKELSRARDELVVNQQQLRSLASEMSLIEERGRRKVAEELHDRIGHGLAACQIQIDTLQKAKSQPDFDAKIKKPILLWFSILINNQIGNYANN